MVKIEQSIHLPTICRCHLMSGRSLNQSTPRTAGILQEATVNDYFVCFMEVMWKSNNDFIFNTLFVELSG